MAQTVADALVARLRAWGVERIYGYPGDGINGILSALDRVLDAFTFVQVRHEEEAAFMACADAKFTGGVGVCLATSGPGAIHLLNGLYDARLDRAPVFAIVGQQSRLALGGDYQQEVDLEALFRDVAGRYVQTCMAAGQLRHLVDRAMRVAKADRCVTCLVMPSDVQELEAEDPPHGHATVHSGVGHPVVRTVPPARELERAAAVLNAGERVAMLVGLGAAGAVAEVEATADRLGAGVAKALLAKAVLSDDMPGVTGQIGFLGTRPSWELMQSCDTLLMVGTSFPYTEYLPEEGRARGVQIDVDPHMLSIRYPMEVNLAGDAKETLEALLPLLRAKADRSWREGLERDVASWWRDEEKRARVPAEPLNPELVFWEASERLPERCVVTADSGSTATWFARALRLKPGMAASLSGTLATMCPGLPYAVAAKFCFPDRPAVAFVGDGAMQMLGLAGLVTVAKYWRRWTDPRLVVLVLNNGDLNQVTWELRALGGHPKIEATQDVPDVDYAAFAESLGLAGVRMAAPDDVGAGWECAFAADRPVVVDARVDPTVAAVPPHISYPQARNVLKALAKGDPDTRALVRQMYRRVAS
jgi:pyruvate dehydrogenase (quinone)